jgi:ribose transport system ATP-binding protein
MAEALLEMRGIEKRFGGVHALRGVDFDLRRGEVHALLGENGAGKSTLMNILSGVIAPDQGTVAVEGRPVRFASPRDAQASGIATIFQELDLVPGLDVAANLFLGHEISRPFGRLDGRRMRREAQARLAEAELAIDVRRPLGDLSIGQRQLVAIAKALAYASRILVMDEPTAALTAAEVEHLFKVVRGLCARGVGIVYISHRLEEVAHVADRVTVMRDGKMVGETAPTAPQGELVRLLVGRPLDELFPPRTAKRGPALLRLEKARYVARRPRAGWQLPEEASLAVHAHEIVGLAGLMGAGRTELLSALYGVGPRGRWQGGVEVGGRPARLASAIAARRAGLAYVTDDRRGSGLMLRQTTGRNIVMSVLRRISPFGLMSRAAEGEAVRRSIQQLAIRPPRGDIVVGNLSGGNQQKVVFAKELLSGPRLLLLDEPTRGVDVGAKAEIYQQLRRLAESGLGVLVASSELPELIGLCDRIVVMRGGRTVAEFASPVDEATLLACANGRLEETQG